MTKRVQVEDRDGNTMPASFTQRGAKGQITARGYVRINGRTVVGTEQFGRFYPDQDGANAQLAFEAVRQSAMAAA